MLDDIPRRDIVHAYRGEGKLLFKSGPGLDCRFLAIQLRDASIFIELVCAAAMPTRALMAFGHPERLEGKSASGEDVTAGGNFLVLERHFSSSGDPSVLLRCNWLHFGEVGTSERRAYALTNFKFTGTNPFHGGLAIRLRLRGGSRPRAVVVHRAPRYEDATQALRTVSSVEVTAMALVDGAMSTDESDDLIDVLCHVLSVARGTVVQYVCCEELTNGKVQGRRHLSRVTKPYCPLCAIDWRAQGRDDTKRFIETSFPRFLYHRKRLRLRNGTIAAYLDAKSEGDYLEMRGVKAAVAIEMFKSVHLAGTPQGTNEEFYLPPEAFDQYVSAIHHAVKDVLKDSNVPKKVREKISQSGKVVGLNRRTFGEVLKSLFRDYQVPIDDAELKLFVRCRNSLVHTGDFYCDTASDEDRERLPPKASPWEEYCLLIEVLDRLFLKLLGYSGPYVRHFDSSVVDLK